jgi:hypothetical protein
MTARGSEERKKEQVAQRKGLATPSFQGQPTAGKPRGKEEAGPSPIRALRVWAQDDNEKKKQRKSKEKSKEKSEDRVTGGWPILWEEVPRFLLVSCMDASARH